MKKLASLNDCKFYNKFNESVTHVIVKPGMSLNIVITVKILKFETPQTIAIIVLKIETFDVTLH